MDETRGKLLEAAGEVFAESGFERATVRAICDRAQVKNLAAVNYYFGSKEKLYESALLEAHRCGVDLFAIPDPDSHPPADQLRMFIRMFLEQLFTERPEAGWHHRLMIREMVAPTPAIDVLVREVIRPRFEFLVRLIQRICPEATEAKLRALAFSVIGQCLHYKFAREVNRRLVEPDVYAAFDVDFLSRHICQFTLAAFGFIPALGSSGESTGSPSQFPLGQESD